MVSPAGIEPTSDLLIKRRLWAVSATPCRSGLFVRVHKITPCGTCLSLDVRRKLYDICRKRHVGFRGDTVATQTRLTDAGVKRLPAPAAGNEVTWDTGV